MKRKTDFLFFKKFRFSFAFISFRHFQGKLLNLFCPDEIFFAVDIQEKIQISLTKKSDKLNILEDVKKEIYKFMEGKI